MKKALLPLFALLLIPFASMDAQGPSQSSKVAGPAYDGCEVTCDLPAHQQFKNIGSKLDGAGMCVFSSIEMAALYQGLEQMRGYRDWWASVSRGGGWPQQVDKSLNAWWKHKNIKPIPYLQYEGKDPEAMLRLIDKTGRMAAITYGWSPRYGQQIAHMVNCTGFNKYGIVLDNNFVSKQSGNGWDENIYEWMSPQELVRRAKLTGGSAWIFVWLTPPPPPPARPKSIQEEASP